ncbi:hypothetical protein C8J56DRAFT_911453 [Mycena floridula]|nr:hypothetical protein C8J56DRAFT_911453 [Mycena floridula]
MRFDATFQIRQLLDLLSPKPDTLSHSNSRRLRKKTPLAGSFSSRPSTKRTLTAGSTCTTNLFGFSSSTETLIEDDTYYSDELGSEAFCVLRVQNKLLKVKKSILDRDNSAFSKMFQFHSSSESNDEPICLSDKSAEFCDLLHILDAFPTNLPTIEMDETSCRKVGHLINVAEMAHKYVFRTVEQWAVSSISTIVAEPNSFEPAPVGISDLDDTIARILEIATIGHHASLLDTVTRKLITHILWYNLFPGPRLLEVAERHCHQNPAVNRVLGVLYYRMLVNLETTKHGNSPIAMPPQPKFPPRMNIEKRMRSLAAQQELTNIWNRLSSTPPPLPSAEPRDDVTLSDFPLHFTSLPNPHSCCIKTWSTLWLDAVRHVMAHRRAEANVCFHDHRDVNPAAVMENLKQIMLWIRSATSSSNSICVECSLGGLEAIAMIRDEIIDSLAGMFSYS